MAHAELYARHSTYDSSAPWSNSDQPDIRDLRHAGQIGAMLTKAHKSLSAMALHEVADLLEAGRA